MSEGEYVVLRTFDSEGEARVVESFLKAKGFNVQLLGAHAHQTTAVRGFQAGVGMRLIILDSEAASAEQAMKEAEQTGAPELNMGTPPPLTMTRDYVVVGIILALALGFYFFTKS